MAAELRAAGCVFAEDEAQILIDVAEAGGGALRALVDRRVGGEPLEHVVGWVDFAGLRLHVGPGVFVPRQRTALLAARSVAAVSESARAGAGVRFLEAFCGVGPVATAVTRAAPGTRVHLGDHDETALEYARKNVGPSGTCCRMDGLAGLPDDLRRQFDVIAAVPPYVPEHAAAFLPREALEGEAPSSLFGGDDGLDHARRLIDEAPGWLRETGMLLIELGREQALVAAEYAVTADRKIAAGHATHSGFEAHTVLGEDEQTVVLELRRASTLAGE